MLSLSDGGEVALDWVLNESSSLPSEVRPTMIIMPGLVGQYCLSELELALCMYMFILI